MAPQKTIVKNPLVAKPSAQKGAGIPPPPPPMPIEERSAKKNPAAQKGAAIAPPPPPLPMPMPNAKKPLVRKPSAVKGAAGVPPPPPPMPKASVQKTRSGRSLQGGGQAKSAPLSGARKSREVRPRDNYSYGEGGDRGYGGGGKPYRGRGGRRNKYRRYRAGLDGEYGARRRQEQRCNRKCRDYYRSKRQVSGQSSKKKTANVPKSSSKRGGGPANANRKPGSRKPREVVDNQDIIESRMNGYGIERNGDRPAEGCRRWSTNGRCLRWNIREKRQAPSGRASKRPFKDWKSAPATNENEARPIAKRGDRMIGKNRQLQDEDSPKMTNKTKGISPLLAIFGQ